MVRGTQNAGATPEIAPTRTLPPARKLGGVSNRPSAHPPPQEREQAPKGQPANRSTTCAVTSRQDRCDTPAIAPARAHGGGCGGQRSLRMSEPSSQDNPVFNLHHRAVVARCIHVIADAGVADALDVGTEAGRSARHGDWPERRRPRPHPPPALDVWPVRAARQWIRPHVRVSAAAHRPSGLDAFVRSHDRNADELGSPHGVSTRRRDGQAQARLCRCDGDLATHPEEAQIFNRAMIDVSGPMGPAIAGAYDFSRFATLVDVGGGLGHLARAIVDRYPTVEGVCFDVPHVVADTETSGKASTRLRFHGGDFFIIHSLSLTPTSSSR